MTKNRFEFLLVVVMILLVLSILGIYFVPKAYATYVRKHPGSLKVQKSENFPQGEDLWIQMTDHTLYRANQEALILRELQSEGEQKMPLDQGDWHFETVSSGVYALDYKTQRLLFYDNKGVEKWRLQFKHSIKYVNALDENLLLYLSDDEGVNEILILSKEKGVLRRKALGRQSLIYSEYCDGITTLLYYGYEKKPYMMVDFLNAHGADAYQVKFESQLVLRAYPHQDYYFIETDRELLKVKEGKPLWRKEGKGQLIQISKGKNTLAELAEVQNKRMLRLFDFEGKEVKSIPVDKKYGAMFYDRGHYYIWDKNSIIGYNERGEQTFDYLSPDYIKQIWFLKKSGYIWTGERLITLSFIR